MLLCRVHDIIFLKVVTEPRRHAPGPRDKLVQKPPMASYVQPMARTWKCSLPFGRVAPHKQCTFGRVISLHEVIATTVQTRHHVVFPKHETQWQKIISCYLWNILHNIHDNAIRQNLGGEGLKLAILKMVAGLLSYCRHKETSHSFNKHPLQATHLNIGTRITEIHCFTCKKNKNKTIDIPLWVSLDRSSSSWSCQFQTTR